MTNKSKKKKQKKQDNVAQDAEIKKAMEEPWLEQKSGLMMIGMLSAAFAIFMIWQLYPSEGWLSAILWGLGSAAAIWGVFLLAFGFNKLVRR